MIVLLTLAAIVKYPDTITARITLTGTQPVVEVVARESGHLESLRVHEAQRVSKGEIMASIQSPSNSATVLAVAEKLGRIAAAGNTDAAISTSPFAPKTGLASCRPHTPIS